MLLIVESKSGDNLLTPDNMLILYDIFYQMTNNITLDYNAKLWTYDDLCSRLYDTYINCNAYESGLFALFGYDNNNWDTQAEIQGLIDFWGDHLDVCTYVTSPHLCPKPETY